MLTSYHFIKFSKLSVLVFLITSCSTTRTLDNKAYGVQFLDEYVVPENFKFQNEIYGGISGVDYTKDELLMVNDSPSNPLIFKARLKLNGFQVETITFKSVIKLQNNIFFEKNALDMESIRYDGDGYLISTEGSINSGLSPRIFKVSKTAEFIKSYLLPDYFMATGNNQPRHNGVFEGLSNSINSSGFWFANELPLKKDGKSPKLYNTNSPIRLSFFDHKEEKVTRQYAMDLDRITKIPLLPYSINGLTEILQIGKNTFLVLERSYSAGHKSQGNKVKLYLVDVSEATDIHAIAQLEVASSKDIIYAEKSLIFDFKSIKRNLTKGSVDNLEGLCFGPILPNGNSSIIVVSDNNFNKFGTQLNQIILLELKQVQ